MIDSRFLKQQRVGLLYFVISLELQSIGLIPRKRRSFGSFVIFPSTRRLLKQSHSHKLIKALFPTSTIFA